MSKKKVEKVIERLTKEVHDKLDEIRALAVENNVEANFCLRHTNYNVLLPDSMDEEDLEWMQAENGVQVGDWVSSSDYCC